MDILFITSSRLGDAVLSTGLLDHIVRTYPGARVTVVCGGLAAPLFEGVPGLAEIVVLKKKRMNGHWFDLWKTAVRTKWGMVVDLRNSAVSRLIPAKTRYIFGAHIDSKLHKVEQNAAVMGLSSAPPAPCLWITPTQADKAAMLIPGGGPVLAVGPTANWAGKTWAAERFVELITLLTAADGILPGARVAVFAAPGEEEQAHLVLSSIPADRRIDVIAKADPGTAAAALARCVFYVGNDSGLMHCAAAAGVKTLGLFGPSWPHLYRPWGPHCAYVSTPQNYDELIAFDGYDAKTTGSLMNGLTVRTVADAARSLF